MVRASGWDNGSMADRMREALGRILDQFDERRRAIEAHELKVRADDERFLRQFAELRRDVIRPVFESAGAVLLERGHRFSVTEQEFGADAGGQPMEAAITLTVVPAGTQPSLHADDHARSLSIMTRHYNKTVWINSGESKDAGGRAGAKGAHAPDKINAQLVEDEVLAFVAKVLGE